jgi:hypothetical protein
MAARASLAILDPRRSSPFDGKEIGVEIWRDRRYKKEERVRGENNVWEEKRRDFA